MLTVLSWNVHGGGNAVPFILRFRTLLEAELARFRQPALDIIALQDASAATISSLAETLTAEYTIVDSQGLLDSRVGLLVALRKATISSSGERAAIGERALETSARWNGSDFRLVNAYLPHATKSARKAQLGTKLGTIEAIRARARGPVTAPMIVCGDFNTALTMCTSAAVRFRPRANGALAPDFTTLGPRSDTPVPFNELAVERAALLGLIADGFTDPGRVAGGESTRPYSNWGPVSKPPSAASSGEVTATVFLRPLDYIIAARRLGLQEHRFVHAAHRWYASDHLPVLAALDPEKPS